MLIIVIDEVTFYWFECLVHAFQDQIMPVRRQTQKFTETCRFVLNKHGSYARIKKTVLATKLYYPLFCFENWLTIHHFVIYKAGSTQVQVSIILRVLELFVLFNNMLYLSLFFTLLLPLELHVFVLVSVERVCFVLCYGL